MALQRVNKSNMGGRGIVKIGYHTSTAASLARER